MKNDTNTLLKHATFVHFFIFFFITCLHAQQAAHFYVSPTGNDQSKGTIEAPFASLSKARNAVKEFRKNHTGDILIYIRGGRYNITETILFNLSDSGTKEQSITYAAYPNETPILSGGTKITQWSQPESLSNIPEKARDQVVSASVLTPIHTLFDDKGILQRARSAPFITPKGGNKNQAIIPEKHFKNWSNKNGLEIWVRPHHAWIVNILPIIATDNKSHTVTTDISSTYPMNPLHFLKDTPNAWIENSLEELDQPGEWVYDPDKKRVYLWRRNDSNIYYPRVNEIIRVEGDIKMKKPSDKPVKNLHFIGLTFQHGDRYQISKDDAGLQHDWNMLDKDNALVRFRGTENCSIRDCHFHHSGSGAIRADLHSINNTFSGNHIEHMGGSGILLCGYGPGTKDVNRKNLIHNNHIHHVGKIHWHSPGIMIWQSGENNVSNNYIHHTNYTGLILSGCMLDFFNRNGRELGKTIRWHEIKNGKTGKKSSVQTNKDAAPYLHSHDNVIEYNEISHVMQQLGDGNAIYVRGAGANNLIQRNYIHHLITPMIMQCAVRTDGGQKDTIIRENIIYKCTSQGMMLKLNNTFENNIIADIISPPRGYYLSLREGPMHEATIRKNIFYSSGTVEKFISQLSGKNTNKTEDRRGRKLAKIEDADADYNIYFSAKNIPSGNMLLKQHQSLGVDKNSLSTGSASSLLISLK